MTIIHSDMPIETSISGRIPRQAHQLQTFENDSRTESVSHSSEANRPMGSFGEQVTTQNSQSFAHHHQSDFISRDFLNQNRASASAS